MPDDPTGVRELRFRYDKYHVIVNASPEGDGQVRVINDFFHQPDPETNKKALVFTLNMLSIARRWVLNAYLASGGTLVELRRLLGGKNP